jgi:UDP-N-acetyl-D-glucosamine dehydrogenase
MNVCIVGYGYHAEHNVEMYMDKHVVSMFVPFPIRAIEEVELKHRMGKLVNIFYEPSSFYDPQSIANADVYIICVNLKYDNINRVVDMDKLTDTVNVLRRNIRDGCTVLLETAVGVGVTRSLFSGLKFHVAYSPSNFDPNNVTDKPSDIPKLIGGMDPESETLAATFYDTVYDNVVMTGSPEVTEAAVMLKFAKQTMEDAIMNEFADFCEGVPGLDIHSVVDATSTGHRGPKTTLPWIGRASDINSHLLMYGEPATETIWPVLSAASSQLTTRPSKTYKDIVRTYCGGDYEKLHKMAFLVVGVGTVCGSPDVEDSPVFDIIRYLELEGALVVKYDMFIDEYNDMPNMSHNSGGGCFDGILVMHPYNVTVWSKFKQTTFYCRH